MTTTKPTFVYHDVNYLKLVEDVLKNGVQKKDRTGTGTVSVFSRQMRFDLSDGTIPLLTTKKMHVRSIIHEILWYLQGNTNVKYLQDNNVTIWDEWADKKGDLGPVYGKQWRKWDTYKPEFASTIISRITGQPQLYSKSEPVDQIKVLIDKLKTNPDDRRLLVSAWNVGELDQMALPPCHYAFQFWTGVDRDGVRRLSCMLNQRSCDVGLGVPFNIVQYSILTRMIAQVTGLQPGEFIWNGGDVHVYMNHVIALSEQLKRAPKPSPVLKLNPVREDIDTFTFDDFKIVGYESHPAIKMEVAV